MMLMAFYGYLLVTVGFFMGDMGSGGEKNLLISAFAAFIWPIILILGILISAGIVKISK